MKEKKASVKMNFIYQTVYEILILMFPLITAPYISRVLGAANVGIYSYTYTISNYFVLFSALGIRNYGIREIAKVRDDEDALSSRFSELLLIHLLVSAFVIVAYIVYLSCFCNSDMICSMISGAYVVAAFFDISWFFFGIEKFRITIIRNALIRIASLFLIFALVKKETDLWIYVLILAGSQLFSQLYLWFYIKRYTRIKRVRISAAFYHVPQLLILFIPTIAISLYNYMDKIMVGAISNTTQLGYYENSEKIISVAITVIGSLGTVMMPRMSNIIASGNEQLGKKYIDDSMQFIMMLACAMAFGIAGTSFVFAPIFWGKNFSACSELLFLLAIVIPFKAYANVIRTQYLIPKNKDKEYTLSVCIGAAINLAANFILIPRIYALGAVIGTILAEVCVCVFQAFVCRKELPIILYCKKTLPYIVIGFIMFLGVYFEGRLLGSHVYTLMIQFITGIIIYICICLAYVIKTKNILFLNIINGIKKKFKN